MNKLLRVSIPVLVILGLILAAGCAKAPTTVPVPPSEVMPQPIPAPAPPSSGIMSKDSTSGVRYNEATIDRKIVKTGYMTLEVADIGKAIDEVAGVAKELGGYVVSSEKHGDGDNTFGRASIRVPADRFDEAFDRLRKLAVNVPNESTQSQDVTEEYTDLQSQLRNLEATEAQYLELLKKAEKVEDILAVQRELSNVRGQIEQVKGRIQYLERTSDMALIEVNLQKTKPIGGTGWSALETLKSAARGLITFGKALANIAIWLAIFSPVWIIILVVVLYFTRWRKKKAKISR
jgi:hypothetical protein